MSTDVSTLAVERMAVWLYDRDTDKFADPTLYPDCAPYADPWETVADHVRSAYLSEARHALGATGLFSLRWREAAP